ncbi:MAG: hypothetical protein IKK33_05760 [Lachnospiraceae bacterium]|nr:hypothetical protein [Lachnospiraceae bacterium]
MSKKSWEDLQPLRIPPGWTIVINKLENIEPEELDVDDERWLGAFTEDILYMHTKQKRKRNKQIEEQTLAIDLGWYPDSEPTGNFRLVALLNDNWQSPLLEFSSRSKQEIIEVLEQWLFDEFILYRFIEEDVFRKFHSK